MKQLKSKTRRPTLPMEVICIDLLPHVGLSMSEFAKKLGVNRSTVCGLFGGRLRLSVQMALRIEETFNGALGSAESWLAMQMAVDLWDARQHNKG